MGFIRAVYAQEGINIGAEWQLSGQNGNGGFNSLAGLVSFLLPKAILVGGIIFFVMIIIAGFGILMGAGSDNEQDKEKSKNFLTYGVIGLAIMFGAYWIMQIINKITGGSLNGLGF